MHLLCRLSLLYASVVVNQQAMLIPGQPELSGAYREKRPKYGGALNLPNRLCCTWGLQHTLTGLWTTSHTSLTSSISTTGKHQDRTLMDTCHIKCVGNTFYEDHIYQESINVAI